MTELTPKQSILQRQEDFVCPHCQAASSIESGGNYNRQVRDIAGKRVERVRRYPAAHPASTRRITQDRRIARPEGPTQWLSRWGAAVQVVQPSAAAAIRLRPTILHLAGTPSSASLYSRGRPAAGLSSS